MADVLIIDDEPGVCRILARQISRQGNHAVEVAHTLGDGLRMAGSRPFDLVFLDVRMPDGDGLDAVVALRNAPGAPEVVVITGYGDRSDAERAIRRGAWDYLIKPFSRESIESLFERTIRYRSARRDRAADAPRLRIEGLVGISETHRACLDFIARAAAADAPVLITGETGTGKELVARNIHGNSRRADRNFVVVDCAALPATLVESALFGHVRGAFTGADRDREGLVRQAHGGTLFLDEVGELPPAMQKAFLRVLQERRFRPVGGREESASDFRLVAATHRNLETMAVAGEFRQDLLYRLRALFMELSPLRGRNEDIRVLAAHFMEMIRDRYDADPLHVSSDFLDALCAYDWPGNIRELIHTLEGVFADARGEAILFARHLPERIRIQKARSGVAARSAPSETRPATDPPPADVSALPSLGEFRESILAEAETRYLNDLMARTRGSIREACRISGLGRTTLYALLRKRGVSRTGWPRRPFG
jgi:two-component system, NtrC family, response regulator